MKSGWESSRGTLNSGGIDAFDAVWYAGLLTSCPMSSLPYCDIWSSSDLGKKHGVSHSLNLTGAPHACSIPCRKARYFSGVNLELNSRRRAGIIAHHGYA